MLTETKRKRVLAVATMTALTLSVVPACGGSPAKPEKQASTPPKTQPQPAAPPQAAAPTPPASPAGQLVMGESQVVAAPSREVSRTISSEMPLVHRSEYLGDVNRMTAQNFEVMGIAPGVSQNIVSYRSQHSGKFSSVDDLKNVPGMTTEVFDSIKGKLGVSP